MTNMIKALALIEDRLSTNVARKVPKGGAIMLRTVMKHAISLLHSISGIMTKLALSNNSYFCSSILEGFMFLIFVPYSFSPRFMILLIFSLLSTVFLTFSTNLLILFW